MKSEPVYFGPFLGEPSIELLFWIPWVRKYIRKHKIPYHKRYVISRGGVSSWYSDIISGDNYINVENAEFSKGKHFTSQDAEVLRKLGISQAIHPSKMFAELFSNREDRQAWYQWLIKYMGTDIQPITQWDFSPSYSDFIMGLPRRYVVVKAYHNRSVHREFETFQKFFSVLKKAGIPIVSLDNIVGDDHVAVKVPGAISIQNVCQEKDNLALQCYLIQNARLYIGNFGGTQHFATMLGVNNLTFTDHGKKVDTYGTRILNHYFPFVAQDIVDISEFEKVLYDRYSFV
jgi:hypothetical protein